MRTPNTKCIVCEKPLYRRPKDMEKARFSACVKHRAEAQKLVGITEAQQAALSMGRQKGTNHLNGVPKTKQSNTKRSQSVKEWCKQNPEAVSARGEKLRGENHYRWSGGASKLNQAIRRMTENRKWMDAVKRRDGCCTQCGSGESLEAHHLKALAEIIQDNSIESVDEARRCPELWDVDNGVTLCQRCHYQEHGRKYAA